MDKWTLCANHFRTLQQVQISEDMIYSLAALHGAQLMFKEFCDGSKRAHPKWVRTYTDQAAVSMLFRISRSIQAKMISNNK